MSRSRISGNVISGLFSAASVGKSIFNDMALLLPAVVGDRAVLPVLLIVLGTGWSISIVCRTFSGSVEVGRSGGIGRGSRYC